MLVRMRSRPSVCNGSSEMSTVITRGRPAGKPISGEAGDQPPAPSGSSIHGERISTPACQAA